jgi:hypothetical protein
MAIWLETLLGPVLSARQRETIESIFVFKNIVTRLKGAEANNCFPVR